MRYLTLLNIHVGSGHNPIYPRQAQFKMVLYTGKVLREELLRPFMKHLPFPEQSILAPF